MPQPQHPAHPGTPYPAATEHPRPDEQLPEAAAPVRLSVCCEEEELEFRPIVKYTAIGVMLALLLGLEYATYRGGYDSGYQAAVHSDQVEASINEAAVENLRHFMQAASADDDTLLSTIADRGTALGWVREPTVRREAEWMLAQSALDRGRGEDITDLLAELFREAPATEIWARRALISARYLAATADTAPALEAYRTAIARLATLGMQDTRLIALNEMASLLSTTASEGKLAALEALQAEVSSLGEAGRHLRSDILGYMGRLYREQGDHQAAMRCFEAALAGVKPEEEPALAGASVCYGLALLETGETARGEALLREGVSRLGDSPADVSYLVSGLRALAQLEDARGAADAALAHLYRAEGAATNRIPAQNSFWGCLYDQRGWVNLRRGAHDAALTDFRRAIDLPAGEDVLVQSFEGAGDCCIVLGDAENAILYLSKAAELRERLAAHDPTSLAQVYSLRGRAHDMRGDAASAAADYRHCAELLSAAVDPADVEKRIASLIAAGYALGQQEQWAEAAELWQQVQPLVEEDAHRRSEVSTQLNLCRRYASSSAAAEGSDEEDAADEAPAPRRPRRNHR